MRQAWDRASALHEAGAFDLAAWRQLLEAARQLEGPRRDEELEAVAEFGTLTGVIDLEGLERVLGVE